MSIKDELLQIKGDKELLQAEDVVEWARKHTNSALHNAAEFCGWDLKKSAMQHWLYAARRLIAIHVVNDVGERKFISLSIDRKRDGGGYRDVDDVMQDKTLHDVMLDDALNDLKRVEHKYQQLKKLQPIWAAAEKLRKGQQAGGQSEKRTAA